MKLTLSLLAMSAVFSTAARAGELEVTHWWTSGGEAAAVKTLAETYESKTGNSWVDGAIAGSGGTARPIIISRILGGDPMGATQMTHGRQAEELIEAGMMLDITDVAEANGWTDVINPPALLEGCTVDGRIYCAPLNIHSAQWLWLSHKAFEEAGVEVPETWSEFVAAAPALKAAGKQPLALGQQPWQSNLAFGTISLAVAGLDAWKAVNIDKNAEVAAGPDYKAAFEAVADAREMAAGSNVQDWNQATNMVITDAAGGQIMGDWAQGEFAMAGEVAGKDYSCLPGLGVNAVLDTGGDAIYFPVNDDPEVTAMQKELAEVLLSPEVQVAFNLAKGSLPVRGDIDMSSANACMQKGLEILAGGSEGILPSGDMSLTADTTGQVEDLMAEFWADSSMSAADAQARFAEIIADAD